MGTTVNQNFPASTLSDVDLRIVALGHAAAWAKAKIKQGQIVTRRDILDSANDFEGFLASGAMPEND